MSIFSRETQLALSGELQAYLAAADEAILRAVRSALLAIVDDSKQRMREQVVAAKLGKQDAGEGRKSGRSLASAIRAEIYPRTGLARNPAALLYVQPSAVHIFEAFEEGATIRAGGGKFITIPIPGSPASREQFGDKPRGQTVLERLKAKGIEIAFVPGNGSRPAMLVANSVRLRTDAKGRSKVARATKTKAGAFASGTGSVPLFFLVPQARIAKRLNLQREFERASDEFFQRFTRELNETLARIEHSASIRRAA